MTTLQYITSPTTGCCTTGELMTASKTDKTILPKLKEYAEAEMKNKGMEIDAPKTT